jgi:hypothetical protein
VAMSYGVFPAGGEGADPGIASSETADPQTALA